MISKFIAVAGRSSRKPTVVLLLLLAAAALAGCVQTTPTPKPTPTPTATPTPTPPPTKAEPTGVGDISLPAADPDRLDRLSRLLSPVPEVYISAVFMDVRSVEESPLLQDALDLDTLGLTGALPPVATGLLDGLVLVSGEGGEGAITVLDGAIDVESLLDVAGSFGISLGGPEAESYRDHQIWGMDVFGLTLAVGTADDSTTIFSSGSPLGGAPALEVVKGALDSFDGLTPRLLGDPSTRRLVDRLPSGFVTAVFRRCTDLPGLGSIIDLPGCAGAAVSADVLGEDTVVFYGLAGFDDESLASAALQLAREQIEAGATSSFGEVAVGQEGPLVWTRVLVDATLVSDAVKDLAMPEG